MDEFNSLLGEITDYLNDSQTVMILHEILDKEKFLYDPLNKLRSTGLITFIFFIIGVFIILGFLALKKDFSEKWSNDPNKSK